MVQPRFGGAAQVTYDTHPYNLYNLCFPWLPAIWNAETAETPIFAFQTALTNITTIHKIPHNYMVHSWSFLVILLHMLVFETISLEYRTWPQRSNAPPFMLSGHTTSTAFDPSTAELRAGLLETLGALWKWEIPAARWPRVFLSYAIIMQSSWRILAKNKVAPNTPSTRGETWLIKWLNDQFPSLVVII